MAEKPITIDQAAIIGPVVDKLISMMGAARDAFNRHSRASLEELKGFQAGLAQEIDKAAKQVSTPSLKSEADKAMALRVQSILHRLQLIGENIGALTDPIQRKIKDGILFSDKAVSQTNYLFDHHTGILRSVQDILKTDNAFLKKYMGQEAHSLILACTNFATEHEDRMIEGLCLPQAAPIFLTILDRMRALGQHEVDIAGILARKG
jgi:Na+/phosphate symporter